MVSLARRTITSIGWNAVANTASIGMLFVRSVLLARLLPVEAFGIYTGAQAIVGLTVVAAAFGMGGAFIHRAPETADEGQAAAVHFTLRLLFAAGWGGLMVGGTLLFAEGATRTALLILVATAVGVQLVETPRLILARRVEHRRLAGVQVLGVALGMLVSVVLAWKGATLWALLAIDLVNLAVGAALLYVWRPVWRPRLVWDKGAVRYFLRFGARNFLSVALGSALDRIDALWTRFYLGITPMGFYSRAYAFATYPRRILATPINAVTGGTYAELKGDRRRLSQAFFRTTALLVRAGFFLAGLLALVAPELIRLLIGHKWLPMLDAFRVMLAFTMLDPIRVTIASLFVAQGRPEIVVRARSVQLVVLAAGILLLGPRFGITGVAIAVNITLVVGVGMLLWEARAFVDYSPLRLLAVPTAALALGMFLARAAITLPDVLGSDWRTGAVKVGVFVVTYALLLGTLERRQIGAMVTSALGHVQGVRDDASGATGGLD